MAIVKNGKLRGQVGNSIHRVYKGREIVQSYPQTLKPSGDTLIENTLFGECSRMNALIYRLLKDFALEHLGYELSWKTMAIFKRLFFKRTGRSLIGLPNWRKINEFTNLPINENILMEDILFQLPEVDIDNNKIFFWLPPNKEINRLASLEGCFFIEFSVSLIHYDFQLKFAEVIYTNNSGRRHISQGLEEQEIEVELPDSYWKKEGLIIVCVGLRFFFSSESYGYLNSEKMNPTEIVGMWYKGGTEPGFDISP